VFADSGGTLVTVTGRNLNTVQNSHITLTVVEFTSKSPINPVNTVSMTEVILRILS
jgi:hypothetical protein